MNVITLLGNARAALNKINILKEMTESEKATFVAAYSPYLIYHLKFKEYDMDNLGEPSQVMFNLLDRLVKRGLTGTAARDAVERHAEIFGDLIKLICNKDLRCGVTATTYNKVYPGAIPQFKVQLAKEVPLTDLVFPKVAQIKYDGVRIIAINKNGKVSFRTRNGNFVNLPRLKQQLEFKGEMHNYILDGELVYGDGAMEGRTSVSGLVNSAMHGGIVDESNLILQVFDHMLFDEWTEARCDMNYKMRWSHLVELLSALEIDQIRPAYTIEINREEDAMAFYDTLIAMGYEGMILKDWDHKYTFKRSKDWVKVKEIKTADLECVGTYEGKGKYKGQIGGIICEGEVEGTMVEVDVGSGLTDAERSMDIYTYLDQTIEVKYNSLIQDSKTGQWSLFLPRFVKVRLDK